MAKFTLFRHYYYNAIISERNTHYYGLIYAIVNIMQIDILIVLCKGKNQYLSSLVG